MTERTESYGARLAELMKPELARNPQPIFKALQESTPVLRLDGVGVIVTHTRAGRRGAPQTRSLLVEHASAHDLKTKRPLIPLQIDPPDHRKYRKLLDPLFAPQRMRLLEEPSPRSSTT